jgi:hypothetical protein
MWELEFHEFKELGGELGEDELFAGETLEAEDVECGKGIHLHDFDFETYLLLAT